MSFQTRIPLIKKIQDARHSHVFCYLTSLRPGVPSQISEDAVRVFFDHLALLPKRKMEKLDLFLCSNGGQGTVPWRMVALFREFAESFNVLVPYRAYSAASLIALGADEIVMHPFAELGPIDPTVQNDFNPVEQSTGRRLGISVEDVKAYVTFIKSTVGITHEDELIQAVGILAEKVHPLALGNVERFLQQSRMIAKKILKTHMSDESDNHTITEIVENMASKLYFHGHPINRKEAKKDLGLKVVEVPELDDVLWELYKDYEAELQNTAVLNPAAEIAALAAAAAPGTPPVNAWECDLLHALIESQSLGSSFTTRHRFSRVVPQLPPGIPQQIALGQVAIQDEILEQGWHHSPAQQAQPAAQP